MVFMYGHDYDSSGSNRGRVSPLSYNIKVYQIADKPMETKFAAYTQSWSERCQTLKRGHLGDHRE
jgi:hypothetical protein